MQTRERPVPGYRNTGTKGTHAMANTTVETEIMISFVLLRDPRQVAMTRCLIRAALEHRDLGSYADNAARIASELVTNAIQHATTDIADKIGVTLMRVLDGEAVGVVVTDPSPVPPVKRDATAASESGRGLWLVEALSAYWAWNPEDSGKAVYAIVSREE
jgi:anti-sigma regulatory factor (Ser/Thr protein kinase)